jgi:hypothetical protein
MEENRKPAAVESNMDSFEGGLFGTLLQFYQQTVRLVRESSLNEDTKIDLYQRLQLRLDELAHELESRSGSSAHNLTDRLKAIYNEAKRMVDECDGGKQPGESPVEDE